MTQPSEILPPNTPPPQGAKQAPGALTPLFPDFKPLEMSDRPAIEAFTEQFEPYSDFCFSTLTFYNINNSTHWCWLNGNLVLRFCDAFGHGVNGTYFTFLGCEQAATTANTLIVYAQQTNCSPILWRVPEISTQAIRRENETLRIDESRDGFDYIYSTDALARLIGPTFIKARNDVSRFKRRYPQHRFATFDLRNESTYEQLRRTISSWQSNKSATVMMDYNCRAFEACLHNAQHFDLHCLGVVINDSLVGFLIYEQIRKEWLIGHFGITNLEFTGLFDYLLHHMIEHGQKLGCTHYNNQEDLGHPGLRHFKMKYAPSGFLRKFRISQVDNLTR